MKLAKYLVRLPALLLAFPLAASATIYKWTDEHGTTVYSNRAPAAEAKVSNVQVALQDEAPASAPAPANPDELQARVRALEQQIQALQGQPTAQVPPPVSYYPPPDYYPTQPYQSSPSYPADYYSSMYGYGYPYYPYYPSYIVVTGRRFVRPVHPVHRGFVGARPVPVSHAMGAAVMGGSRRR
jgi:hypothetical protein